MIGLTALDMTKNLNNIQNEEDKRVEGQLDNNTNVKSLVDPTLVSMMAKEIYRVFSEYEPNIGKSFVTDFISLWIKKKELDVHIGSYIVELFELNNGYGLNRDSYYENIVLPFLNIYKGDKILTHVEHVISIHRVAGSEGIKLLSLSILTACYNYFTSDNNKFKLDLTPLVKMRENNSSQVKENQQEQAPKNDKQEQSDEERHQQHEPIQQQQQQQQKVNVNVNNNTLLKLSSSIFCLFIDSSIGDIFSSLPLTSSGPPGVIVLFPLVLPGPCNLPPKYGYNDG